MPLDTYSELVESMADDLASDDLEHKIQEWIWLSECQLQREFEMEPVEKEALDQTWTGGDESIACPADFIVARYLEFEKSARYFVKPIALEEISTLRNRYRDGLPRGVFTWSGKIYTVPNPTADTTYDLYYYGGITHLSETETTNILLYVAPDALKYLALVHSAPYLGADERIPMWSGLAGDAIKSARITFWNQKVGGGPLQTRPDNAI
jgi:hypothetical protein